MKENDKTEDEQTEDEKSDGEVSEVERSEIERPVDGEELKICPRDLWNPQDSPRPMDRMKYPVKAVYWTNSQSKPCYNRKQCLRRIRELQEFHLKGGMFDIPFNFLVGGDCKIYEGRGWDWGCLLPYTRRQIIEMYKHPYQNASLVIAYIGQTLERDLNHPMVQAGDRLIDYAKAKNMIIPGFETIVQPYWVSYSKNMHAAEAEAMLEIVTRQMWKGMPSQWDIPAMNRPATHLWVIYTGGDQCREWDECVPTVRALQRYHIEQKEVPDMPYSFVIGSDGRVYEGRGWGVSVPEPYNHPELLNTRYIIAFLGEDFVYPHEAIENIAMKGLIEYGIKHGWLAPDFGYYQWDDVPYKLPPCIEGWTRQEEFFKYPSCLSNK